MIRARNLTRSVLSQRTFSTTQRCEQGEAGKWWRETAPTSFAIGSAGGIVTSLAGMGGGFVVIPLMTSRLLNLTQHQAHGTSLCAIVATGLVSAVKYGDHVQYQEAASIGLCAMLTAGYGARFATKMTSTSLKRLVGVVMLAIAPLVPAKAYFSSKPSSSHVIVDANETADQNLGSPATKPSVVENNHPTADSIVAPSHSFLVHHRLMPAAGAGLASGFFAGLTGVGGGTIVIPILAACNGNDLTHHQILGTSLAAMTSPAAVGSITYMAAGNVVTRVAPPIALGAVFGGWVGSHLGLQADESTLQWGFSALVAVLGLRNLR